MLPGLTMNRYDKKHFDQISTFDTVLSYAPVFFLLPGNKNSFDIHKHWSPPTFVLLETLLQAVNQWQYSFRLYLSIIHRLISRIKRIFAIAMHK